jgi:hypothetical protein
MGEQNFMFETELEAKKAANEFAAKDKNFSVARGANIKLYSVSRPDGFTLREGGGKIPVRECIAEFHYKVRELTELENLQTENARLRSELESKAAECEGLRCCGNCTKYVYSLVESKQVCNATGKAMPGSGYCHHWQERRGDDD